MFNYYGGNFFSDFFIYFLAIIIVVIAQGAISSAYQKYKRKDVISGLKGEEVARLILDANDLQDVRVEVAQGGILSDHYDPIKKVVRLSSDIFYKSSIAAVSIAAHEVGHAIQDKEKYGFIALRNRLLPAANISSRLGWIAIFVGLLLFNTTPIIFFVGLALLVVMALFQLVTLPVELNASSRAIKQLNACNVITMDEEKGSRTILRAAAFTYIASLIATLLQILRFAMMVSDRRN